MPLLNICSVVGNKKTIQVGLCFLSGEKEGDYEWAMEAFRELMVKHGITEPLLIVTDREIALMNCLDTLFPSTPHILCVWHVNMNILANCRKLFPKDKQILNTTANTNRNQVTNTLNKGPTNIITDPKWEAFLKDWALLLASATEEEYTLNLTQFRKHEPAAVKYVEDTWLIWKEKLVNTWVSAHFHFGIRFTSPIEGCHAMLKAYIRKSTSDLKGVFDNLVGFWPDQHRNIHKAAAQEQIRTQHRLKGAYFHVVQSLVYDRALFLILAECAKLYKAKEQGSLGLCTCKIEKSMGLPCFHTVEKRLASPGYILPEDIHPFWWYKRPDTSTSSIAVQVRPIVLAPAVVRSKGRPRGSKNKAKDHGITATRRNLSQFEQLSSSAPAILGRSTIIQQSTAVSNLMAQTSIVQDNTSEDSNDEDNEFIDIDEFIDPQLQQWNTTTQLGHQRMKTVSDTMLPGTLLPRLYQTNPFAVQLEPTEIGGFEYQLSSKEVPATAQELQQMAEEEAEEESLSQAVNDIVAMTTRAGRKRKAVGKVVENARQKLEAQKGRKGKK
jgi:hypothetical protein